MAIQGVSKTVAATSLTNVSLIRFYSDNRQNMLEVVSVLLTQVRRLVCAPLMVVAVGMFMSVFLSHNGRG